MTNKYFEALAGAILLVAIISLTMNVSSLWLFLAGFIMALILKIFCDAEAGWPTISAISAIGGVAISLLTYAQPENTLFWTAMLFFVAGCFYPSIIHKAWFSKS